MKVMKLLVKRRTQSPLGSPQKEQLHSKFLSQTEKDLSSGLLWQTTNYDFPKEEYLSVRSLQSGRSAGIKLAGKKYTVAVWDQDDYLKDTKKQLSDEKYTKRI